MVRIMLSCLMLLSGVSLSPGAAPPGGVDYLRDIKPILKERCYACHGSLQQKAGLRLDTVKLLRQGGDSGPVMVPGEQEESLLVERLTSKVASRRMPPEGSALTQEQIEAIRSWIRSGAKAPANETPEPDPRGHWAFRKLSRPAVPPGGGANPIDRFVEEGWRRQGLQPAPEADRATLLRRVYLDLTGLPPTKEELEEYLGDSSPWAYEKVVDRLLASPRYGERWGRHWLDVWRYSDWYGRRSVPDVLNSYGMIWRWRDWVVRSLNEDRPYDRMVQEMLAADELAPNERDQLVATGFLVRNFFRWNYNQWMRDNVEHTGKAFLGLTLQCAQCHDHKYDPITQVEYFRFRAFFEPLEIRHDRVAGEADPGVYPKYSYGASYKPITSGMVRVFDEKLDAPTYMYSRGDERNRIVGKGPVKPGAPAFLGGDRLTIVPVELPVEAYAPGVLPFVQEEEERARQKQVEAKRQQLQMARQARKLLEKQAAAEVTALAALQAKLRQARALEAIRSAELAAAEAEWLSVRARIAADNARHKKTSGEAEALAQAAARAEKVAAWQAAQARLVEQEQKLQGYTLDGPATEVAKAQKLVVDLRKTEETARQEIAKAGNSYTSLGPRYPTRSSGRRLALARWITSRENPLTARVAVNHVWNWHFGQPLVESTANFGRQGALPTHPELLDWLACELQDNGWRFKELHRLLVTSQVYRMASGYQHPSNRERDADNRLLWRFPIRRLEAEVVRDGLLHAAGELQESLGGPDIAQEQGQAVARRSLYFTSHNEGRMVFLDLFDAANPADCYRRATSVRPQQALALMNSELPARMARRLAAKLYPEGTDEVFVEGAFRQVLARAPVEAEREAARAFLVQQKAHFREHPPTAVPGAGGGDTPSLDPARRARENLLLALFNHTDFVTVR